MSKTQQIFELTSQIQLIIPLGNNLLLFDYCDMAPINFLYDDVIITIANGPTYFNVQDFQTQLKAVLNDKLELHPSITLDIGYLRNKFYKNNKGFIVGNSEDKDPIWVGESYYVWRAYAHESIYMTWLYNYYGNIIFEITPFYPYFFCDIKKERYFVPYKQWIKNYKPYFKTQLSRETAQQWYEQADHFVKTVDDNIAQWKKECEEKTCETCSKREQRKKIAKREL